MILSSELIVFICYVTTLLLIGFFASRHHQTASDFLIGGRSLNFLLTALAAHASDMSAWLFIGLPFLIFTEGGFEVWNAVGLILFMFLNWILIARRLRIKTEQYNSFTLSSFFESCFKDTTGITRIFTAVMGLVFYTIYVTAGTIGMGLIIQSLFGIPYIVGITVGLSFTVLYLFIGGYRGLAWVDCFQALFLLCVILFVPLFMWPKVDGWEGISSAFFARSLSVDILPEFSIGTIGTILFVIVHFGIGYFGQPHIITKFMGINDPSKVRKSMTIGIIWQFFALGGAVLIGFIGVAFFSGRMIDSELVFSLMVKETFHPVVVALILCAVLAAIISTMDSQILILGSSLSEDFYKRIFRKKAGSKELLWISRLFILLTSSVAYLFALSRGYSIYKLVFYAWAGLGASFGPLVFFALFSKKTNKYGAWAGILSGGVSVNIWYFFIHEKSSLIAGFLISSLSIYLVSRFVRLNPNPIVHK